MKLSEIVCQDAAIHPLREALMAKRLPHALLFVGPKGVGKASVARALVASLFCGQRSEAGDACGVCDTCAQVRAESHTDLHFARPDDKGKIGIDAIRELKASLSRAPFTAPRRVAFVDSAEELNEAAQNAFLKTLEEPPGQALIILVASRIAGLIPTVRSRCQTARFGPLPEAEVVKLLRERFEKSPEDAALLARHADGSPGIALDRDPEALRDFEAYVKQLVAQSTRGYDGVVEAARTLVANDRSDPKTLPRVLEWMRSELRAAARGGPLTAPGQRETVLAHLAALEAAHEGVRKVGRNANRGLAIEQMLSRIGRALGALES